MPRDSYKGIPKKAKLWINEDGSVDMPRPHPHNDGGSGKYQPIVTGSGTLTDGYALLSDDSIGFHTMVLLTAVSGNTTTDMGYVIDPINKQVHVSGGANVRFSYMLINPGLGSQKVS